MEIILLSLDEVARKNEQDGRRGGVDCRVLWCDETVLGLTLVSGQGNPAVTGILLGLSPKLTLRTFRTIVRHRSFMYQSTQYIYIDNFLS